MTTERRSTSLPRLGGKRRGDRALTLFAIWLIAVGQLASLTALGVVIEALLREHDHAPAILTLSLLFGGQIPAAIVFRKGVAAGLETIGPHLPRRFRGEP